MSNSPSNLHDLQVLLFPLKAVSELGSMLNEKFEAGKVQAVVVGYLEQSDHGGRKWHYAWAASDDIKLPLSVLKGGAASLEFAIHSTSSEYEHFGNDVRDY